VTVVGDRVRSRCWVITAVVSVARSRPESSRYVYGILPALLLRVGDRAPADTTNRTP
jgi:hypothetical protein